jgi:ferric-dicitrate binding protein FerR (iron transport regulator)
MNEARFAELIELYLDQQLSSDDAAELRALVELDPAAADRFAGEVHRHLVLAAPLRSTTWDQLPARVRALIALARPSRRSSLVAAVAAATQRRPRSPWFRRPWVIGGLAASLVMAGWIATVVTGLVSHGNQPGTRLASDGLTEVLRDGRRQVVASNVTVQTGDRVITRNHASRVQFADGSEVALAPGSALTLDEDQHGKHLTLVAGTLTARVAKQPAGRPFRVVADDGVVEVVGTVFHLDHDPLGTRLRVDEGRVLFSTHASSGNRTAVTVAAGQEARASAMRPPHLVSGPIARGRPRLLDACEDVATWRPSTSGPQTTSRVEISEQQPFDGRASLRLTAQLAGVAEEWAALSHTLALREGEHLLSFRLRVEEADPACHLAIQVLDAQGNWWSIAGLPISASNDWREIVLPLTSNELPVRALKVAPGVRWDPRRLDRINVVVLGGSARIAFDALVCEAF